MCSIQCALHEGLGYILNMSTGPKVTMFPRAEPFGSGALVAQRARDCEGLEEFQGSHLRFPIESGPNLIGSK